MSRSQSASETQSASSTSSEREPSSESRGWGGARANSGPKSKKDPRELVKPFSVGLPAKVVEWIESQGGRKWLATEVIKLYDKAHPAELQPMGIPSRDKIETPDIDFKSEGTEVDRS